MAPTTLFPKSWFFWRSFRRRLRPSRRSWTNRAKHRGLRFGKGSPLSPERGKAKAWKGDWLSQQKTRGREDLALTQNNSTNPNKSILQRQQRQQPFPFSRFALAL